MHDQSTALIPLRAVDGSVRAYAVVDAADAEWANQWRWQWCDGYADRKEWINGRPRHIRLHRELLGLSFGDGMEGDHIDRDRLNCRRSNLRAATKKGNRQNTSSAQGASSRHRGVSWEKGEGKWEAHVQVDGKKHRLGRFRSEEDAAEAARAGRLRLLPYAVD